MLRPNGKGVFLGGPCANLVGGVAKPPDLGRELQVLKPSSRIRWRRRC